MDTNEINNSNLLSKNNKNNKNNKNDSYDINLEKSNTNVIIEDKNKSNQL
jgi:hypothetical protein